MLLKIFSTGEGEGCGTAAADEETGAAGGVVVVWGMSDEGASYWVVLVPTMVLE